MRSDDVKRMLEAAAAEPSRPLDAGALLKRGARLRRARFAAAVTGLAVVVAGASTSFSLLGTGEDVAPAASCTESGTSASMYLRSDVSEAEIAELKRRLDESSGVTRAEYVSKDAAFEELRRLYEDQPAIAAAVPRNSLPASFRIETADSASLERIVEADWPAVDEIKYGSTLDPDCLRTVLCESPTRLEMSVFLRDDATPEEIRELRSDLRRSGDAGWVRYVSKRAAFQEFKKLYVDQPDLWDTITRDALPASIRVRARDEPSLQRLHALVTGRAGVDEVKSNLGMRERWCPDYEATPPAEETTRDLRREETRDLRREETPGATSTVGVALLRAECDVRRVYAGVVPEGKWCRFVLRVVNEGETPIALEVSEQVLRTEVRDLTPWPAAMEEEYPSRLFVSPIPPHGAVLGEVVFLLSKTEVPERLMLRLGEVVVTFVLSYDCSADLHELSDSRCPFSGEEDVTTGIPTGG